MKKYHLAHHYKNYELAFGVTSAYLPMHFYVDYSSSYPGKIWDIVFNTVLEV